MSVEDAQKALDRLKLDLTVFAFETKQSDGKDGTITPPVGNVLFVGCSLAKQRLENVMKSLVPFFVAIFISLMLVTYIPALSEWLPTTLGLM